MNRAIRTALIAVTPLLSAVPGLTGPGTLRAQEADTPEPLVTDRPDFTESAVTIHPGRVQLELGYTFTRSGAEERHSFGELLVRVGALGWLEGRLGLNSLALTRAPEGNREGLEELRVAGKAILYRRNEDTPPAVPQTALLFGADLPTGSGGEGEEKVQPGATLALQWDLPGRLGLGSNLGWTYRTSGDTSFHEAVASASLGVGLTGRLGAFFEHFGFYPENEGGSATHFLNAGITFLVSSAFQLDWRIGAGLQDPDPNWFTGLGAGLRL
jgi:hypothetical protein